MEIEKNKASVLIIDDEKELCLIIKEALLLNKKIFSDYCLNPFDALKKIEENDYDLIMLDYKMPGMDGFDLLDKLEIHKGEIKSKIILMTAYGNLKMGNDAIKKGCFDYVAKPFNIQNILFRVQRVFEHIDMKNKIALISNQPFEKFRIISRAEKMNQIKKTIKKIADKDVPVLIEGETGTGKELFVKSLHRQSKRKNNILIPINCSTLSDTLLESELFGYEKGAFTGADIKKHGILESANGGTVFLDEIDSASLQFQAKLLRVIETGEFIRLGSNKIITCDIRIIVASNKKFDDIVDKGIIREDMYYRLNVVKISVPPLRERKEDIPLLINYYLNMYNKKFEKNVKFNNPVIKYLINYKWPGNVRQLKNMINSIVLLKENETVIIKDIPRQIIDNQFISDEIPLLKNAKDKVITRFEKKYLDTLMYTVNGNVTKASNIAGLSRNGMINKLKTNNINPRKYKIL